MCGTFLQFCCAVIQTFCCPPKIQSQIMVPNSSVSLAWRVMIFLAIIITHTSFAVIIVSQTSLIRKRYCSAVHGLVWPRTHFRLLLKRTAAVPIRETFLLLVTVSAVLCSDSCSRCPQEIAGIN